MADSVRSLASLLKRAEIDDHGEVLSAADQTLKKTKGDLEAQHVKIVALLNLDRFQDAVEVLEAGGSQLKDRARLEYAYALYKTGRAKEAVQIASQGSGRGYSHVEAQAKYRIEDFRGTAKLYEILADNLEDDVEADLRINTGATNAQLEWAGQGHLVPIKKPGREDLEAFETAYNAACASIARGELGQGEVLLKRAADLCASLDELDEDEKEAELLPIRVQQVFVLAQQGRHADAETIASKIEATKITDKSTRYIARINKAAVSKLDNPFLIERLVAVDESELQPDNPFAYQTSIIASNKYATSIQCLKFDGTIKATQKGLADQKTPTIDAHQNLFSAANAAAHAQNKTGKEALKHVLPLLEKRPYDIGIALTAVQLQILSGNVQSGVTLLEALFSRIETTAPEVRFAPGLVGTAISLYHSLGRRSDVRTEFSSAVEYWRSSSSEKTTGVVHLLKAAGVALLESQDPKHQKQAREIFGQLHEHDKNDRFAAAGFVAASPQDATKEQSSSLTPIDRLIKDIDVDALERAGVAQPSNAVGSAATTRKRAAEDSKPKPAKKIRKSKMPKDYDPAKKMDAERWLPLRDRSYYRPKGKKGKAKQALLSQGSAPVAAASDDSRPATPGVDVVKGKQGGGGAKKKKGKKW